MFEEGINEFWDWWAGGGRTALERAIEGDDAGDLAEEISARVADIHPALEWQLAPGASARHSLALSGGGLGTLRLVAQTWANAAPAGGKRWEFHGARIPVEPTPITIAGVELDPATLRWTSEPDPMYEQLDLQVGMDGFAMLEDQERMQAVLFFLDAVLGEDESETWIGVIDPVDDPPPTGKQLEELPAEVAAYAKTATGEGWDVVERDVHGKYSIATVNRALKHLHHMDYVLHCEIIVSMNETTPMGLPTELESADQEEIEEDAVQTLGDRAVFVARETIDLHRHLHFFAKDSEHLADELEDWADEFDSHDVSAIVTLEPDWSILNRWL